MVKKSKNDEISPNSRNRSMNETRVDEAVGDATGELKISENMENIIHQQTFTRKLTFSLQFFPLCNFEVMLCIQYIKFHYSQF